MHGTILVAAYMEAQDRARSDFEAFKHSQMRSAITNALWAYRTAQTWDEKREVRQLFAAEFAYLNRQTALLTHDTK